MEKALGTAFFVARAAALVAACGLVLAGCGESGSDAEATATGGAGTAGTGGFAGGSPRDLPAAAAPEADDRLEALKAELPSLARVEQALAGAPVNINITRGEQLAAAREWIAENKPDLSPREAELLAQMLVMFDEMRESEDLSLARAKGMGESQLLQLWALDADGDGRLSDEEAAGSMERMMKLQEVALEYNMDEYDTDGDGEVSGAERQAMSELMMENMRPLMDTMVQRATLVAWDSDRDGTVSDAEREAGEASLDFADWDQDGEISQFERMAAYGPLLQEFNNGLVLLEQPDMQAMQAEFQTEMQERVATMNAPAPTQDDFDLDGDGELSDIEQEAFDQELAASSARRAAMGEEMRVAGERFMTRLMQAQFDIAVNKLDQNSDGLLINEEWEAGYENLRGDRDRRMFNYLYDADRSGSIADAEVARFMDSYEKQIAYADADLDGRVDEHDLRYFLDMVTGQ